MERKVTLSKFMTICDINVINTDKNSTYGQAIKELKQEGGLAVDVEHVTINWKQSMES